MTARHVTFPCGGVQLEGVLHLPEGTGRFPAVVICHPHPLYGGDMDNNVVVAICSALVKSAIVCLRFNFRGAGDSGGSFGGGVGEQDDVKAALDFLANSPQIDSMRIGLAGYSFGGSVVLPVALMDSRVKQLALISPALKEAGWAQLKDYVLPKLI
ncbi:MAG: CocE/NonD family hydrolase, partial [Dehalococcoidales bacterium]|nr:CocE/NonD family hydrolase [Dehalococcoidales bacterium]